MTIEVVMPQMGQSVAEGTVIQWFKEEGEYVEKDEALLTTNTDKIDVEIPSPGVGILSRILVRVGETVPVRTPLAYLEAEETHHRHTTSPSPAPHGRAAPVPEEAARWQSPAVLELAEQHGLKPSELQQIPGTGRDGRVTKKDLLAYLEQRETVAVPGAREEIIPFTPMRRAIAEHMVRSKHTSPHATAIIEVDMTAIAQFREREKAAFAEAWRKHNMGSYERFQWLKSHLEAVEGCEPHHARVPFRPVLCRAWWTPQQQGTCGCISHDA